MISLQKIKDALSLPSVLGLFRRKKEEKDFWFFPWVILLFVFLVSYLLFNRKPLNIINNVLLIILLICSAIRVIHKKLFVVNPTVAIFAYFGIWGFLASLIAGVFTYITLLHCALALAVYLNVSEESRDSKEALFQVVTYCFDIFAIAFLIYYLPSLKSGTIDRFGAFFGNQDYVAATLGLCVLFNLFFLARKKYYAIFFILLSSAMEMATQTRMAFFIIFLSILGFLISKLWRKKGLLALILSVFLLLSIGLLCLPPFAGIRKRLVTMAVALFRGELLLDDSMAQRLSVMLRSYQYGLSMPFFAFGYDAIVKYGITTTHDSFGQLAFCGGSIYSIVIHAYFFWKLFTLSKRSRRFHYLALFALIDFTVNFFLGTPFYNRYFFIYMPLILSISDDYPYGASMPERTTKIKV